MKKLIAAIVLAACMVIPALAQSNADTTEPPIWDHGDNVSALTYENVPVYQIWDHHDAYIVFYQKQGLDVGTVTIPKTWVLRQDDGLRRLQFRNKPKGMDPYMTVFYKNGEFYKVMITVPNNRADRVWGVAPHGTKVDAEAQTLNIVY